jgi:hypothetical protein
VRRLAVPIIALALVAGCGGGSQVTVQEAPGEPVELTVPGGGEALAPTATPTPTPTEAPADTAAATATPAAPAEDPSTQAPEGTEGGGAAAPDTGEPPPPGSDPEQYEEFCAQNPGAC